MFNKWINYDANVIISEKMTQTRSKPKRLNDLIKWDTVDDIDKVYQFYKMKKFG